MERYIRTCWERVAAKWLRARQFIFVPDPKFGLPGVRDSKAPCEGFEPVVRKRVLGVVQPAWEDCDTDGHYLCDECLHRTTPERRAEITGYPVMDYDLR